MPKKQIEDVKITKKQGIDFINNLLNIATHEWSRVIYCFLLKLFVDTGKVIGHAVLLAMVTVRLGILNLPIIMVISGILIMISTTFFSRLLHKVNKKNLLGVLGLLASILLVLSRFVVGSSEVAHASSEVANHVVSAGPTFVTYLFFAIYLVAEAVLFVQLEIILALYIEEHFTALESQRTFPVIESAPIFAGILGGSLITFLGMQPANYIYVWAFFIMLILPTMFLYGYFNRNSYISYVHDEHHDHHEKASVLEDLKKNIKLLKIFPYLRTMTMVVFFYMVIFSILELKYAIAIFNATESHGGESSVMHGLGIYVLSFSVAALFIQLLLSSRIIRNMGIINSMLINPLMSLISFFFMLFFSNAGLVIGSRFIFDSTTVIYKNAYLSSFYAIAHKAREKIKVLIEGWAMPLGKIFGTFLAVLCQYLLGADSEILLRISLVIFATTMVILLFNQRKNYTNTALRNLDSLDIEERFNAIEVLGEEGHVNNTIILTNKLTAWIPNSKYNLEKIKVLETLARLKDESTLPIILDCLEDKSKDVRLAALFALSKFKNLGKKFYTQTFARYRVINTLKELFEKEDSKQVKANIIKIFANLKEIEVVPFLLEVLKKSGSDIQADCISVIGNFNDPNIAYYLKPYLASKDSKIKANTIIALWQFKEMRLDLLMDLNLMIEEGLKNKDVLLSFIYASGELQAKQEEKKLLELMDSEDLEIRQYAALALAKIGNEGVAVDCILELIFSDDYSVSKKTKVMIERIPDDLLEKIKQMIEHEVSFRINTIMNDHERDFEHLDLNDLERIKHYYNLIDEKKDVARLDGIIEKKGEI